MKQYFKQHGSRIIFAAVCVTLAFLYAFAAVGCHTVRGIGVDIQRASDGISSVMSTDPDQ